MVESVYFDTCVWGRTLDELRQPRVRREFEAVLRILAAAARGRVQLLYSEATELEISRIPGPEPRESLEKMIGYFGARRAAEREGVQETAAEIARRCGIGGLDAVHIAFAIHNRAARFLTVDDAILKRRECVESFGMRVENPITLAGELYDL